MTETLHNYKNGRFGDNGGPGTDRNIDAYEEEGARLLKSVRRLFSEDEDAEDPVASHLSFRLAIAERVLKKHTASSAQYGALLKEICQGSPDDESR